MVYSATDEDSVTLITLIQSRKLKENFDPSTKRKSHTDLNLEDGCPIDLVPSSSKATIKPKPIAHGSPLMPYITAAKQICIANCRDCVFFLGVNQQPFILGDNHKLQGVLFKPTRLLTSLCTKYRELMVIFCRVAPHNTFYPQLEEHMSQVGVDATINSGMNLWFWEWLIHMTRCLIPSGVSMFKPKSATSLDPYQFTIFLRLKKLRRQRIEGVDRVSINRKSSVNVIDAKTMSPDPVVVIELPNRVPYGFHVFFVTESNFENKPIYDPEHVQVDGVCNWQLTVASVLP
ncbi:hypothetical protein IFM89_012874 [Coptis chinensis]|uniref:Uncharacterized protein n=1 Tax=Coptis chinensis TaxID=261450 RepID=A0A835HAD4_9MAGN|nr:hypothetical protein IFM89_012874 [Coptis chinensis]